MTDEWDGYEHRAPARGVGLTNPMDYVRTCACGNELRAARLNEEELARAISEEQATPRHIAWRAAQDFPG